MESETILKKFRHMFIVIIIYSGCFCVFKHGILLSVFMIIMIVNYGDCVIVTNVVLRLWLRLH